MGKSIFIRSLVLFLIALVATTAKDLAPALRGETFAKQEQGDSRRKLFIVFDILQLVTTSQTCLETSPGVYQTFTSLFLISIYRVYFEGHTAGSCPSNNKYSSICGGLTCGSPNICTTDDKCIPPPTCMSRCKSSFKAGSFTALAGDPNAAAATTSAYTAFPGGKTLKAFTTSMTGYSVLNTAGGNPTLKLYRSSSDANPAVAWTLFDSSPGSPPPQGTVYTKSDGDDLFTISWEGWKTPFSANTGNSQISFRFSTGDYMICYGSGTLTNTCPATTNIEKAYLAFGPSLSSITCPASTAPFNQVSSACGANAAPGNGFSWTWPGSNYCVCGNLK